MCELCDLHPMVLALRPSYLARRAFDVWPKTKKGELTQRGRQMSLDWLVGVCEGILACQGNAPVGAAFVASVRSTDEVFKVDVPCAPC